MLKNELKCYHLTILYMSPKVHGGEEVVWLRSVGPHLRLLKILPDPFFIQYVPEVSSIPPPAPLNVFLAGVLASCAVQIVNLPEAKFVILGCIYNTDFTTHLKGL